MKSVLKVFITENCPGCDEALAIADQLKQNYAKFIKVEIIDMTNTRTVVPEAVFATPTFMLDGRIVSLGNPSPREITEWVAQLATVQSDA